MASSRFSGKQTIKLPAVCHKELYDLPDVYVHPLPTQLTVLAIWRDTTVPVDLAESFPLFWNAAHNEWTGQSASTGWNLAVTIAALAAENTYDLTLELRTATSVLDDDSWHGQIIAPPRPFNSGLLRHVYAWPEDYNQLHVLN